MFAHPNGREEVLAEQFVTWQRLIHPANFNDIEAGSENLAQALFRVTESTSKCALLIHLQISQGKNDGGGVPAEKSAMGFFNGPTLSRSRVVWSWKDFARKEFVHEA